ncbi:MAG: hypothetical protein JWN17_2295 [Frankiales bacterium]|nr:hypothetical protein [Frankiales bacterium]
MGIFKGDDASDGSSGSTLGTPSNDTAEAPPGDDESFVVSGGGVANGAPEDGGPGMATDD